MSKLILALSSLVFSSGSFAEGSPSPFSAIANVVPSSISKERCELIRLQFVDANGSPAAFGMDVDLTIAASLGIVDLRSTAGTSCSWANEETDKITIAAGEQFVEFWAKAANSAYASDGSPTGAAVQFGIRLRGSARFLDDTNVKYGLSGPIAVSVAPPGSDSSSPDTNTNSLGEGPMTTSQSAVPVAGTFRICAVQTSSELPLAYIMPCGNYTSQNPQCGLNGLLGWSIDGGGTNGGTSTLSLALSAMLSGTDVQLWYRGCANGYDMLDTLKLVLDQ